MITHYTVVALRVALELLVSTLTMRLTQSKTELLDPRHFTASDSYTFRATLYTVQHGSRLWTETGVE